MNIIFYFIYLFFSFICIYIYYINSFRGHVFRGSASTMPWGGSPWGDRSARNFARTTHATHAGQRKRNRNRFPIYGGAQALDSHSQTRIQLMCSSSFLSALLISVETAGIPFY